MAGSWSVADGLHEHAFEDGVIVFDRKTKSTLYLGDTLAEVFCLISGKSGSVRKTDLRHALLESGFEPEVLLSVLDDCLAELSRLGLIVSSP